MHPHTAPIEQGQNTIDHRRRSSSSFESYGPIVTRNGVPRTLGSFSSSNTARSDASDLSLLRQTGGPLEARSQVFGGIGQEPRPDTRKPLYPARIKDGPSGSKIARSGAPAMPMTNVAEIDEEYWNGSVAWARQRVYEDDALQAHETEQLNRRHSTTEEFEAQQRIAVERRLLIGTNWVKQTSPYTYAIDWNAWPDIMSEEDSSMAYEALRYWMKHGGSDSNVKGVVSRILRSIQEKITPSTPFPDLPKPRREGKRMPDASIPAIWKEKDEMYAKRQREIDEITKSPSMSSQTTGPSPQPDSLSSREHAHKNIRKTSTSDLREPMKRNASSTTLHSMHSSRLSPPADPTPTSALPPVPPIPPMSHLRGLEARSEGDDQHTPEQPQRQPRLWGQDSMRNVRTGAPRGVLPLTGSPHITPPSGSSDLVVARTRGPVALPPRPLPLTPRQKEKASAKDPVREQKTGSDEEKNRHRSVALSVLEGSPGPLSPDTQSTADTFATAGSPSPTGLGILNGVAERQTAIVDPNAVVPAGFDISGLNITPRQRHIEQSSGQYSDGSVVYKSAQMTQAKRTPDSGLSHYEGAFSPQVEYELPEGATDPYGDDYEMDETPSKPARPVHRRTHRRDAREDRGLMDFTWTVQKAQAEAQSMVHPAFRSPPSQERLTPPRPSRVGAEMLHMPVERNIDQAISAWERSAVAYRDAETQTDPEEGMFF